MSAPILRRGDRIHIQFPVPGIDENGHRLTDQAIRDKAREEARVHTDNYASYGIGVTLWTASANDPTFRIVAVFRDEKEVAE